MIPQDHNSAHRDARWIAIENVGSTTIPPFGVCEVVDSYRPESGTVVTPGGGITVLKVQRPSESEACNWVVNWSCEIPVGETGIGTKDSPMNALVDSSGYVSGDILGVQAGSYALTEGLCGFIVDGDYDATYQCIRVTRRDDCPDEMMVRATECSEVGESAYAQPQVWDDVTCEWIDDTSRSAIVIDDPMCWRMALGPSSGTGWTTYGELYEVRRPGGWCQTSSCNYMPARPFGLKRRVIIKEQVACEEVVEATVLDRSGTGTGTSACEWEETECKVWVCNTTNRTLACDANETGTAIWHEGDCVASFIPDERAKLAIGTINEIQPDGEPGMCGQPEVRVKEVTFIDVCEWEIREDYEYGTGVAGSGNYYPQMDVRNQLGLYGCIGDKVLMVRTESCRWDIINVTPHVVPGMIADVYCDETGDCKLKKQKTAGSVAVQQCEDCDEVLEEDITGDTVDVLVAVGDPVDCTTSGSGTGQSIISCGLTFIKQTICILGCVEPASATPQTLTLTSIELQSDSDFYQSGLSLKLDKYYREVCVICVDAGARIETDTVVGTDCDTGGTGTGA